ncbi:helicase [Dietzia maris]|nr:helicase [Dietzia maris]
MNRRVVEDARGDRLDTSNTPPKQRFWLGRLAPEVEVINSPLGRRAEKLDPCSIGFRIRPQDAGPWSAVLTAKFHCWNKNDAGNYEKSAPISVAFETAISTDGTLTPSGSDVFRRKLSAAGLAGRAAEFRVELESWRKEHELVFSLVNTSVASDKTKPDTHLYEVEMSVSGIPVNDFELEALPDSFRYDRSMPAIGMNCGVIKNGETFTTTDTISVDKNRPRYWNCNAPEPDLTFATLSRDPLPQLQALIAALEGWGRAEWNGSKFEGRATGWSPEMRDEAAKARESFFEELERLKTGFKLLTTNSKLLSAFKIASAAVRHSANGKYDSWRPFQIGFLVSALSGLLEPDDADTVDTVWFATGGGKTETYLGLLVTAIIYDRLVGKSRGITAWTRFPLRMLSLQQTQRFADALAGAELERKRHNIAGAPISLGFFVGQNGTPNKVKLDPSPGEASPTDKSMPKRYQVLLHCPFCRNDNLTMSFNRAKWTLEHSCREANCAWGDRALPFYVVDQEIFRFLPTVIVGTLDKAALVAWQSAMRGFFGPPAGICSRQGHGYTYSPRQASPTGCLVPGCKDPAGPAPMEASLWAPRLRLQDELHLLRDSLGAVDSHYESLLDHLQHELTGTRPKIVASSATLSGFERQVRILYRRKGRVFPQPGPSLDSSFWSEPSDTAARRYVAVAPRGVTLEFVSDKSLTTLQSCVRDLIDRESEVCELLNIPVAHVPHLVSHYGVNLVYGNTVRDVEAARRSAETEFPFVVNSESLIGGTEFDRVREILNRLENPEKEFDSRLHLIAASSMISHGVDVDRLNVMVMKGLPLTTAEFIQTSARVGRRWPGIVYVLHRITREREVATYAQFEKFITQGDRFVEPIPITRASRRVLSLTTVGAEEARRLAVHEYAADGALTTIPRVRKHYASAGISAETEAKALIDALGLDGPTDDLLRDDIHAWTQSYFNNLMDPATQAQWPSDLSPSGSPMSSLRDVEQAIPIVGEDPQ